MLVRVRRLACLVSLLLCVVAAGMWVRSDFSRDVLGAVRVNRPTMATTAVVLDSNDSRVAFGLFHETFSDRGVFDAQLQRLPRHGVEWDVRPRRRGSVGNRWWNRMGFGDVRFTSPSRGSNSAGEWLTVPYWFVCLVLAAGPAGWVVIRWRRLRGPVPGHCQNCSYDLRGSTQRCPECGMPIVDPQGGPGTGRLPEVRQ